MSNLHTQWVKYSVYFRTRSVYRPVLTESEEGQIYPKRNEGYEDQQFFRALQHMQRSRHPIIFGLELIL